MVPNYETMWIFIIGLIKAGENNRRVDGAGVKRENYRAIVPEVVRRVWVTIHQHST